VNGVHSTGLSRWATSLPYLLCIFDECGIYLNMEHGRNCRDAPA
jgi:hypothetical protein